MKTLGAFAIIFNEECQVCCVRLGYAHKGWTTPGGRVEPGESPIQALKREVKEETGLLVEVGALIGVYSKPYQNDLVLNFEAAIIDRTEWTPNSEIVEIGFFSRQSLPQLMTEVARRRIEDGFSGVRGAFREFTRPANGEAT